MTNSRQKGCRIERKAAAYLTSLGFPATRAARNGVDGGEDLICKGLRVRFEVKGDRSIGIGTKALLDAMMQADEGCPIGCPGEVWTPAVLWLEHMKGWRLSYPEPWGIATIAGDATIKAWLVRFAVETVKVDSGEWKK